MALALFNMTQPDFLNFFNLQCGVIKTACDHCWHVALPPRPPRPLCCRYMAPEVFRHELYNHKVCLHSWL